MIDVEVGCKLVVNNKDYPIKQVANWTSDRFSSSSFARMATLTISLKKETFDSEHKSTESVYLSNLSATPLDPINPELRRSLGLDTPFELLQTFISDGTGFVQLIVEDQKS